MTVSLGGWPTRHASTQASRLGTVLGRPLCFLVGPWRPSSDTPTRGKGPGAPRGTRTGPVDIAKRTNRVFSFQVWWPRATKRPWPGVLVVDRPAKGREHWPWLAVMYSPPAYRGTQ